MEDSNTNIRALVFVIKSTVAASNTCFGNMM